MTKTTKEALVRGTGLALKLAELTSTLEHPFRYWFPYAYIPMKHSCFRHVYLPVNRNYKPLGLRTRDWVDYDDFIKSHAVRFSADPTTFKNIWVGKPKDGTLFLYTDSPASRLDYFERYERLNLKPLKILA